MKKGDYVVATKYKDGDPNDPFCVGFFYKKIRQDPPKSIVTDANGIAVHANGYRRVKKISPDVGAKIVANIAEIEKSGVSVWRWVKTFESSDAIDMG